VIRRLITRTRRSLPRSARTVLARVREERGHTLTELLVASTLMIVVLGGTLLALDVFHHTTTENQDLNEAQDEVRVATDRLARDLRNLATATPGEEDAIERRGPTDLIFATVDPERPAGSTNYPNYQWVRYCLNGERPGLLLRQWQEPWTTAAPTNPPANTTCGDASDRAAWGNTEVLASHVTNRRGNGTVRTAWFYGPPGSISVSSIRTRLFVDEQLDRPPEESRMQTGVLLRNRNRPPVASLSPSTVTATSAETVTLNGSTSSDPEGGRLSYQWTIDGQPTSPPLTSVTVDLSGATLGLGAHTVELTVRDAGNLVDSTTGTVTVLAG
jgi:hypothetical protein